MKNLILPIIFMVFLLSSCSKNNEVDFVQNSCDLINFKYYNDTQDSLGEISNEYILIGCDTVNSDIDIQNFISTISYFDQGYEFTIHANGQYKFKEIPLKLSSSKTCEEIIQMISDLEQDSIISYVHYTMQTDFCTNLIGEPIGDLCINSYGSNFYVKVFDENDLAALNQMVEETNTELVKQNEFMNKLFELRATKYSNEDALSMANYFYESGFFEYCEPEISKYPVE